MKVSLTSNKELIIIESASDLEIRQLKLSLNVRIKNHWVHPLVKAKKWDGYLSFLKRDKFIPVGLWKELFDICKEYNFPINKTFLNSLIDTEIQKDDVELFFENYKLFDKGQIIKPFEHQTESVYMFSKYKRIVAEVATSAGKTLIIFMLYKYLNEKFKEQKNKKIKMLLVVPNVQLVIQSYQDWLNYDNNQNTFKALMVSGDSDHKEENPNDYDITIGTFQSLVKKNDEFFESFDAIFVDESQTVGAKSLKTIIGKCKNTSYRMGISGTTKIKGSDADSYGIQEFLGPLLYKVKPETLIEENIATPIEIKVFRLSYLENSKREELNTIAKHKNSDKGKLLLLEKSIAIESEKRLKFILKLLTKTTKNSLVLFSSIEKGYGKKIFDSLREIDSSKQVFYVDGGTSYDNREIFKGKMEMGNDKVLIASFGTFATGISIKNISNIFLVESYKSETLIKQSIGRAMRKLKNKNKANIIDIVDDFRLLNENGTLARGKRDNYLWKHGEERMLIYKAENFPVTTYKVSL